MRLRPRTGEQPLFCSPGDNDWLVTRFYETGV